MRIQPNRDSDVCQVARCKEQAELIYLGFAVCDKCWEKHCKGKINLKEVFKLKGNKDVK